MNTERNTQRGWQANFIVTAGVMATVLLALILAQLDALQARVAPERAGLPIVNIQATAIAVGRIIPLNVNPDAPAPPVELVGPVPDDLNPRPDFITGVSEEGVIFTVCGEVPEGWLLYTTQPGETLASLAAATQSTAADLAAANCLAEGQLTAGMEVLVPRQPAATLCGPPQWWARYQIQRGDTVGALALSRGTTVDEIQRANCRDSLDLVAGQSIFLPPGSQPGAPAPQPSLTPLPLPTEVPTLAPLPTATNVAPPPSPTDPPPSATAVISPVPPTASPPPFPTDPPPTAPPPTDPAPTVTPPLPPTDPPPTATTQPPPTDPPPTEPSATEPPPTGPPPAPGEGG